MADTGHTGSKPGAVDYTAGYRMGQKTPDGKIIACPKCRRKGARRVLTVDQGKPTERQVLDVLHKYHPGSAGGLTMRIVDDSCLLRLDANGQPILSARIRLQHTFDDLKTRGYEAGIYEPYSAPGDGKRAAVVLKRGYDKAFNMRGDLLQPLYLHVHGTDRAAETGRGDVAEVLRVLAANGLQAQRQRVADTTIRITGVEEPASTQEA